MPEIQYYDDAIVVCIKPVGVVSQGEEKDAMPSLLRAQLGGEIFPVHRLDQPTGGVMVFARTPAAAAKLSASMQTDSFSKTYLAVLDGVWKTPEGELIDLLFFDRRKGKSFAVGRKRAGVKEARLSYRVLETVENRTLMRLALHTGRTHQIRVQFASRGFPLTGDGKYGSRCNRHTLALWSAELHFPHPVTGKPMAFRVQPPEQAPWCEFSVSW